MRARLALCYSAQTVELREVVLKDKPAAMLDCSPKGTVPVMQLADNQVIDESFDIMLWALSTFDPEGWLEPSLSIQEPLITESDTAFKQALDRYKYPNRYAAEQEAWTEEQFSLHYRSEAEVFLDKLNQRLSNNSFLFANTPCLADMAILPFIRQFAFVDKAWFDASPYAAVQRWLEAFLQSSLFNAVMNKYPQWQPGDAITLFSLDRD